MHQDIKPGGFVVLTQQLQEKGRSERFQRRWKSRNAELSLCVAPLGEEEEGQQPPRCGPCILLCPHEPRGFSLLLSALPGVSSACLPCNCDFSLWILGTVLFDVFFKSGELAGEVVMAVPAVGPCLSSGGF